MTLEAQRIAIAKACGWDCDPSEAREWKSRGQWCRHPDVSHGSLVSKNMFLPDYLRDLNAMHEAEKVLTGEQWIAYVRLLGEATQEQKGRCHATAAQRAEAFLRATGRWEDTP